MNAKELADKFKAKTDAAVVERVRQSGLAAEHIQKRSDDIEHCKRAMESNVLPFLAELKQYLGDGQFTFAPQIDIQDHKPVGVSFKIGDGGTTEHINGARKHHSNPRRRWRNEKGPCVCLPS